MMRSLFMGAVLAVSTCAVSAGGPVPAGAVYEVGFSPQGQALNIILGSINGAQSSILVAAYTFTSKPIAEALLKANRRGVKVRIIADEQENTRSYSATRFLANQGVPVRLASNYPIHHHKFLVIDGRHVLTGSFNFSAAAAERNAENVLLLQNVKPIADDYAREWSRVWLESHDLTSQY